MSTQDSVRNILRIYIALKDLGYKICEIASLCVDQNEYFGALFITNEFEPDLEILRIRINRRLGRFGMFTRNMKREYDLDAKMITITIGIL